MWRKCSRRLWAKARGQTPNRVEESGPEVEAIQPHQQIRSNKLLKNNYPKELETSNVAIGFIVLLRCVSASCNLVEEPLLPFLVSGKRLYKKRHSEARVLYSASHSTKEGVMNALYTFRIRGVELSVYDDCSSQTVNRVAGELADDVYGLEAVNFEPQDVVIDVGAHVGLVSIYLAKRWPFLQIYAFEPHPANYANCADNLLLNNVTNVSLLARAVTFDGRPIMLRVARSNTGGATAVFNVGRADTVGPIASLTLEEVFDRVLAPAQRCRLLKIDCEGMEYEILPSPVLERVDFFAAEFHEGALQVHGDCPRVNIGQAHALGELCARFFSPERMRVTCCQKQD